MTSTVPAQAPFKQIPFEALPQQPRVAHLWEHTTHRDVALHSPLFGSTRLRIHEFGSGPPLLLVHGLMTGAYSWRYQLERLGDTHTLIMPDLPGAGASEMSAGPYSGPALADVLITLVNTLGIRGCPVVGNSLGGYLVMRAALTDPGAFGRVLNLHSPAIVLPRLVALRAALSVPGALWVLDRLVARDPERWCHRNVHYWDETLKSRQEAAVWAEPLKTPAGRAAFGCWLRDALNWRELRAFTHELAARRDRGERFATPLELVYARHDPMVPPRVGHALHALIPDARMTWLDHASHFAHVDAPDAFAAIARRWLEGDGAG